MERTIKIGDQEITFRASALTVSKYRDYFQLDLLSELMMLNGEREETDRQDVPTALWCMGMFERLAYVMAVQDEKPSFEEWLGGFPLLAMREALPEISRLWMDSMQTMSEPKKKRE